MTRAIRIALLAAAFAVGSLVAWWLLPVTAAAWGAWAGGRRVATDAALAALAAWGALLLWQARHPDFGRLATRLGGVFGASPWTLVVATLLFAALLAAAAAALGRAVAPGSAGPG
ncbi:MAG TPA: hypothetical protein VNA89_01835, partial [Gemmatimonadaceae bacterium]|nr:hypothetical protein [Gemmatimonadaceae bacterium]